ncbi:MAG: substrate-binding domain-containing protein [Alphaproteobacteria bacterium]|nr:substrate-binding domain-containing protein [Alphaproteobacteria bacterium]MCW5742892.1 substrate-binding domain-containing protein [Alphaproteobacteria bacterium]
MMRQDPCGALRTRPPMSMLFPTDPGIGDGLRRRSPAKLRVAHFQALSGPSGIWGIASVNSAALAACEINRRGGIRGREIELSVHDAGGAPEEVALEAARLIDDDDADVIMGCHISAVRLAVRRAVAGRIPYVYTPIYEGGERMPGVLAIGETPARQARPAIHWLAERKNARRWYLIGSDYVWPWLSHRAVKRYIAEAGGEIVGEDFVALGEHDHTPHFERIRRARPDVVFISLIGVDGIVFNRAFGEHRLSRHMLRLANCVDETVLLGVGAENTENLFAASGYFERHRSAAGEHFQGLYHDAYGATAPIPGATAQSNYEGLHFLDAVMRRAAGSDVVALTRAADGLVYRGGRGEVGMRRGRMEMPIFFAEADGFDFRLRERF